MNFPRPFALPTLLAVLYTLVSLWSPPLWGQATSNQTLPAQTHVPQWQIDAGGKMAFEVASIKPNAATFDPATMHFNIPLDPTNAFSPTGGLFSVTNMRLDQYIAFAYKLLAEPAALSVFASLPKWTSTVRFDIEAHAPAGTNPTKDQYRLMMQALLADRFKMAVHYEAKQMPVLAMVLDKPGKFGAHLQPHAADAACSTSWPPALNNGEPARVAGDFPEPCGVLMGWLESGLLHLGARNMDFQEIVSSLTRPVTGIDRPVLDRTGLSGKYDFVVEFTPSVPSPPPGTGPQFDQSGPTFQEALRNQLGLKLVPQTGPVDVLVIDHIEEPSPN